MHNKWFQPGRYALALMLFLQLFSCQVEKVEAQAENHDRNPKNLSVRILSSLPEAALERAQADQDSFLKALVLINNQDPYLRLLVDKSHLLPADYEPHDLQALDGEKSLRKNKTGMYLRSSALAALKLMQAEALKSGISLDISSAYRSYNYQKSLFKRNVERDGYEKAIRESAIEGASQHQLGLAIDFGSITDAFAKTKAGIWLERHGPRFGFSLSYPKGYEELTGYVWESWHYRYVGVELAAFITQYFDGIQQNALVWFHKNRDLIAQLSGA